MMLQSAGKAVSGAQLARQGVLKRGQVHMRTRFWRVITPLGFAVVIAAVWFSPTSGQQSAQQAPAPRPAASAATNSFPAYRAPRLNGHPDLNGLWQSFTTANIDLEDHEAQAGPHTELIGEYSGWPPGQSIVEGGMLPYKPEAL